VAVVAVVTVVEVVVGMREADDNDFSLFFIKSIINGVATATTPAIDPMTAMTTVRVSDEPPLDLEIRSITVSDVGIDSVVILEEVAMEPVDAAEVVLALVVAPGNEEPVVVLVIKPLELEVTPPVVGLVNEEPVVVVVVKLVVDPLEVVPVVILVESAVVLMALDENDVVLAVEPVSDEEPIVDPLEVVLVEPVNNKKLMDPVEVVLEVEVELELVVEPLEVILVKLINNKKPIMDPEVKLAVEAPVDSIFIVPEQIV